MNYKPILFSGEMVRAILNGRKTQTRRVATKLPISFLTSPELYSAESLNSFCPYGQVGDRLWVRESFTYWEDEEFGGDYIEYRTGHRRSLSEWEYPHPVYDHCIGRFGKWIPSIHMPRWASRITLEVTEIRVERLNDISKEDAIMEGIESPVNNLASDSYKYPFLWRDYLSKVNPNDSFPDGPTPVFSAVDSFRTLWDSINAQKYPWESNPWVWVIKFKKLSPEEI